MKGKVHRISFEEVIPSAIPLPYTVARVEVEFGPGDLQEAARTFGPGTKIEITVVEENPE